jgi:membrane AbrB-like protein
MSRPVLLALASSLAAGALASALRVPVAWLLGPLLGMAALNLSGVRVAAPQLGRQVAQVVIGLAIGSYFSPAVARLVAGHVGLMVAGGVASILLGIGTARVFAPLAGVDRTTAFFATVPGGLSEMSILGDRFGAHGATVALSQSLRVATVVILVPAAFALADVHGADAFEPLRGGVSWPGLAVMLALSALVGLCFHRLRVTNAWLLGPMLVGIILALLGATPSGIPRPFSTGAQVLMGCALGARFSRDFIMRAHRVAAVSVLTSLILVLASAALGWAFAQAADLGVATMILATAPGGLPEMTITAKVLELGVPIVAAFHVVRIVMILLLTAHVFQGTEALVKTLRSGAGRAE